MALSSRREQIDLHLFLLVSLASDNSFIRNFERKIIQPQQKPQRTLDFCRGIDFFDFIRQFSSTEMQEFCFFANTLNY